MSDEPGNLVLELLRAIRPDTTAMRHTQLDHGTRLARIEINIAMIRRDVGGDALHAAEERQRLDGLTARIETLERRLELHDQP